MWTKYLLKLKIYCGYNLRKIILFLKEYFPSNSFTLITLWKMTMTFFLFRRSIEGHKWFIPEWPWMTKNVCSSSFFFFPFTELIGRFVKLLLLWNPFSRTKLPLDFLLGFSFLDFSDSSIFSFLIEDTSIYRWR